MCICILYYCHRVATQLQLTNISYHIHFTSHPALIPFPSPHLTDIHPTSNFIHFTSRHFTSLHLSLSNPCSWKYPIFSVLQNPFTLLHFTSLHFTSLHFTSLHFTSLHFTYHFPTPVLGNIRFSPYFKIPSLHFTSNSLHFTSLHFKFPSLHLSHLSPFCFCNSVTFFSFHFNNEYIGLRVTLFVISYILF